MAAASENDCLNDPNFAVICNFLDRYGELIGLGDISYADLQTWLEDTKHGALDSKLFDCLHQPKQTIFVYLLLLCRKISYCISFAALLQVL